MRDRRGRALARNMLTTTGTQSWPSSPVYNWSVAYAYDRAGQLTSETETGVGWTLAGTNQQWYSLHNLKGDTVATLVGATFSLVRDWDAQGGYYTIRTGTEGDFKYEGAKGVVWDSSSQWYVMGRRSYAWKLGRFLTQDPVGYAGGTTNLYSYCGDNPAVRSDSGGLERYLIVVGPGNDNSEQDKGRPEIRFSHAAMWLRDYFWSRGDRADTLENPSLAQLKKGLEHSDGVIFIAHGSPGNIWIRENVKRDGGIDLTADTLLSLLGNHRLKVLCSMSCSLYATKESRKAWNKTADSVFGNVGVDHHVASFNTCTTWGNYDWEYWGEEKKIATYHGGGRAIRPSDFPHTRNEHD